jgi:hypothetical protein
MGNKAIVNTALKVVDQHNVQRFKCEQTHTGLELGDLTEGWDALEKQMIWTYQYKCDSLDGLKRNLASCKECRGWNIIADPEVKPYCSTYAGMSGQPLWLLAAAVISLPGSSDSGVVPVGAQLFFTCSAANKQVN